MTVAQAHIVLQRQVDRIEAFVEGIGLVALRVVENQADMQVGAVRQARIERRAQVGAADCDVAGSGLPKMALVGVAGDTQPVAPQVPVRAKARLLAPETGVGAGAGVLSPLAAGGSSVSCRRRRTGSPAEGSGTL